MARQVFIIILRVDISISARSYHLREVLHLVLAGKWQNTEISTQIVFLLDYTCYNGETLHLPHRGWLNFADINVWLPGGSI